MKFKISTNLDTGTNFWVLPQVKRFTNLFNHKLKKASIKIISTSFNKGLENWELVGQETEIFKI